MERLAIYCADVGWIEQGNVGSAREEVRHRRRTGRVKPTISCWAE